MTRADDDDDDDDDFEDEDPNLTALTGSPVSESGGMAEVSDLLMDVLCAATKLKWLIKEADEGEHRVVAERLAALKALVASIPDAGRPPKRVGFKAPEAKKPRRP